VLGKIQNRDYNKISKLKMNGHKAKKIKQEARRIYRNTMEEMAKFHSEIIKPKPRWFPMAIWIFFLKFFIKINEK
jgi:hypothetical protein